LKFCNVQKAQVRSLEEANSNWQPYTHEEELKIKSEYDIHGTKDRDNQMTYNPVRMKKTDRA